jgi:NADPH2:quinone reductase
MKAWIFDSLGGDPALKDVPCPIPEQNQVLIKVAACGLNFADLLMASGTYQERLQPPYIPGMEFAGTVVGAHQTSVDSGVTAYVANTKVAVFAGSGGLAQYACVAAQTLVALPQTMSFQVAAAFQIAYGTSHLALDHRAGLKPGETLLVLGAAGGVGLTAVEIGKRMGAKVIACARGHEKLQVAAQAGADILIDSDSPDLKGQLKALGGVDVVYDAVGGAGFDAAISACRPEARILTIGFASGQIPQIPANILLVKNLTVMGLYWGGYLKFAPHILKSSMQTLFGWYEAGALKPHISHTLAFEDFPKGLDLMKSRASTGKIVINVPQ